MQHLDYSLIELTKQTFQKYFDRPITDEEAEDIQERLVGYFELLIEWQLQEDLTTERVEEDGESH